MRTFSSPFKRLREASKAAHLESALLGVHGQVVAGSLSSALAAVHPVAVVGQVDAGDVNGARLGGGHGDDHPRRLGVTEWR
jgi:hypothetical protein